MAAMTLLPAACSDSLTEPECKEGSVFCPVLNVGVSDMTLTEETRASEPMSPDLEKYVRSIAIFEFDNEGIHDRRSTTFHFIDFLKGTIDDVVPPAGSTDVHATEFGIVETTLKGLTFEERSNGTLCLVANISKEKVNEFYDTIQYKTGQSYGRLTFDQFKSWALPFEYEKPDTVEVADADGKKTKIPIYNDATSGYIKDMYMFGYYQGKISKFNTPDTDTKIWVDLGRLASRLDITIINETGTEIDKRFGYHFDNVCHSAYFFPIKMGMPPTEGAGLSRTVICAGKKTDGSRDPVEGDLENTVPTTFPDNNTSPGQGTHTRYFYVAAHSAKEFNDATKLHLFYDSRIVANDQTNAGSKGRKDVQIPLCNVHPSEAESVLNGYSLSRNTRYHFTIHVKKSKTTASKPATRTAASLQSDDSPIVEYSDRPGEITVYLPK